MNYSNSDAENLVLSCKAGDDSAFEQLVRMYEPMIIKAARSLSVDVREVYSDACLSLRRAALSYNIGGEVTFGLYAKICVTNSMLDYLRRDKSLSANSDISIDDVAVSDGVQRRLEREEELYAIGEWARTVLTDLEYEVFVFCMKGFKTAEIAEKLGVGAKSVENAKARMLKRLRSELDSAPKN